METCPVCGNQSLAVTGHCTVCVVCGYSGCEKWETNDIDLNDFGLGGLDAEVSGRDGITKKSREED